MNKTIVERFLNQIQVKHYSIITLTPVDEVFIISNLPRTWEQDFIKRKLYAQSDIFINTRNKITPLLLALPGIHHQM